MAYKTQDVLKAQYTPGGYHISSSDFVQLMYDQTDALNNEKLGKNEAAVSANKLSSARTINGVSFDGTEDITLSDNNDIYEYMTLEGNTTGTTAWWSSEEGVIVDRTIQISNNFLGRLQDMQVFIAAPTSFANGAWLPVTYPIIQPLGNDYYRVGGNYKGAQGLGTGLFYRITFRLLKNG